MKFCPKCGGVMMPAKRGEEVGVKCLRCGYEITASKDVVEKYKSVSKPDTRMKVISTKTVSRRKGVMGSREELEQAKDAYYELVLDQMGEYGD